MAIKIDETLYRDLHREALELVRAMVPQLAGQAIDAKKDPIAAVADAVDATFRRVLEGYEKLGSFTDDPKKRPASMRPKARVPFQ